jgi:hypothetical protein
MMDLHVLNDSSELTDLSDLAPSQNLETLKPYGLDVLTDMQ